MKSFRKIISLGLASIFLCFAFLNFVVHDGHLRSQLCMTITESQFDEHDSHNHQHIEPVTLLIDVTEFAFLVVFQVVFDEQIIDIYPNPYLRLFKKPPRLV